MSVITYSRNGPPTNAGGWRDYGLSLRTTRFAWQYRAPNVRMKGVSCLEGLSEGIVAGSGPDRDFELIPYGDGNAPPTRPGFYCAGRVYAAGKLQWLLRKTTGYAAIGNVERSDDIAMSKLAEPKARNLVDWAGLAKRLTDDSANGLTTLAFAHQHWRKIKSIRVVGCVEGESEFAMRVAAEVKAGAPRMRYWTGYANTAGIFIAPDDTILVGVGLTDSAGAERGPWPRYGASLLFGKVIS